MAKLPTKRVLFPLVGESFDNQDGSSRQGELEACEPGEAVTLHRDRKNKFDPNAVLVQSCRGVGLGFLSRADAAIIAPELDDQRSYQAILHQIRGGVEDFPDRGAIVSIAWDGRECPEPRPLDEEQVYFRGALDRLIIDLGADGPPPKAATGCMVVAIAFPLVWLSIKGLYGG